MQSEWPRATRVGTLAVLLLGSAVAGAQVPPTSSPAPTVIASGTGELLVPPTTASFSIGITTSGSLANLASTENARISKAVAAALAAAGLGREELSGSRLSVGPRWTYDEPTRRQKKAGYEATNAISIATDHLDRVGAYIDAALDAGATEASDVAYTTRNIDDARRQVLAQAVEQARADAAAMARAGAGALGELQSLTTESGGIQPAMATVMVSAARRVANDASTVVTPSQIRVTASVVGRWTFVPSGATR